MSTPTSSRFFPVSLQTWIRQASMGWHVPLAVAVRQMGKLRFLPPFQDGRQVGAACRRHGDLPCFRSAANRAFSVPASDAPVFYRCSKRRLVMALPKTLAGNTKCCFLCGCMPIGCDQVKFDRGQDALSAVCQVPVPIHQCASKQQQSAAVTAICRFWEEVGGLSRTLLDFDELATKVVETRSDLKTTLRLLKRMMMYPEDAGALQHAFCNVGEAILFSHLEPDCDRRGDCTLARRFVAVRKPVSGSGSMLKPQKARTARVVFGGKLSEYWKPMGEDQDCFGEWYPLTDLLHSKDDAAWIGAVIPKEMHSLQNVYVAISYCSKRIPHGSCDVDPRCEARRSCRFLCQPGKSRGQWWNRLVAVDVILTTGSIFGDQLPLSILQAAAMLAEKQRDHGVLEDLAVGGLKALSPGDQEAFLRLLFDQCRSIEEPHVKGAAFERFTDGLLQLVPGWVPERLNVTDVDITMEFDVVVFVDPATPGAEYWYERFGPKILIECKNYPDGLQITGESPVLKLHRKLKCHASDGIGKAGPVS